MSTIDNIPTMWWIFTLCRSLIVLIVNCLILKKEWYKRKTTQITIVSRAMHILPLICMISGILTPLFTIFSNIPMFCYFGYYISEPATSSQAISMGFYQLNRLYFCFAKSNVHSDRGYPKCLFILMYIVGFVGLIHYYIPNDITLKCGIDDNNNNFYREYYTLPVGGKFPVIIYIFWDLTTLFLFIYKIVTFRRIKTNENDIVYQRINYILGRIVILTILYELPILCYIITYIFGGLYINYSYILFPVKTVFGGLSVILMNYSIFLMQQHNESEYVHFLSVLKRFKVQYICCCLRSLLNDEFNTLNECKLHEMKVQKSGLTEFDTRTMGKLPTKIESVNHSEETISYH